jgi:hypothetical protein
MTSQVDDLKAQSTNEISMGQPIDSILYTVRRPNVKNSIWLGTSGGVSLHTGSLLRVIMLPVSSGNCLRVFLYFVFTHIYGYHSVQSTLSERISYITRLSG